MEKEKKKKKTQKHVLGKYSVSTLLQSIQNHQ